MIRQKLWLILIMAFIGVISCKNSNLEKQAEKAFNSPKDSICYINYLNAIENGSTFQYFIVINVKDLTTGKIQEICTKRKFSNEGFTH